VSLFKNMLVKSENRIEVVRNFVINFVFAKVVCKSCQKIITNIDDLEVQLAELREEVTTKHRRTTRLLQAGELPPSDTVVVGSSTINAEKHSRKSKHNPRTELAEVC
jgi:hypothetical protein